MSNFRSVSKIIYSNIFVSPCDYNNPQSLGSWFRRRRAKHIMTMLEQCYDRYQRVDILDIGGRASYWNIIPESVLKHYKVKVTLLNDDEELSIDGPKESEFFSEVTADGCNLHQFSDNSFHLVHSNSVVEHVGSWSNMQAMAREIKRLAPCYYVQTPNFWFPVEPHFLTIFYHWLPEPIRVRLLLRFSLGHMNRQKTLSDAVDVVQSVNLIDQSMLASLFPDATITAEKLLGFKKSIIAIKALDSNHVGHPSLI